MEPDVLEKLLESHDELMEVCKSAFSIILKHELLEELDPLLFAQCIKPGFADRAEFIRREISQERRIQLAN